MSTLLEPGMSPEFVQEVEETNSARPYCSCTFSGCNFVLTSPAVCTFTNGGVCNFNGCNFSLPAACISQ